MRNLLYVLSLLIVAPVLAGEVVQSKPSGICLNSWFSEDINDFIVVHQPYSQNAEILLKTFNKTVRYTPLLGGLFSWKTVDYDFNLSKPQGNVDLSKLTDHMELKYFGVNTIDELNKKIVDIEKEANKRVPDCKTLIGQKYYREWLDRRNKRCMESTVSKNDINAYKKRIQDCLINRTQRDPAAATFALYADEYYEKEEEASDIDSNEGSDSDTSKTASTSSGGNLRSEPMSSDSESDSEIDITVLSKLELPVSYEAIEYVVQKKGLHYPNPKRLSTEEVTAQMKNILSKNKYALELKNTQEEKIKLLRAIKKEKDSRKREELATGYANLLNKEECLRAKLYAEEVNKIKRTNEAYLKDKRIFDAEYRRDSKAMSTNIQVRSAGDLIMESQQAERISALPSALIAAVRVVSSSTQEIEPANVTQDITAHPSVAQYIAGLQNSATQNAVITTIKKGDDILHKLFRGETIEYVDNDPVKNRHDYLQDIIRLMWRLYAHAIQKGQEFEEGTFRFPTEGGQKITDYLRGYVGFVKQEQTTGLSGWVPVLPGNPFAYSRISSHYDYSEPEQYGIDIRFNANENVNDQLLPEGKTHILFGKNFIKLENHGIATINDLAGHTGEFVWAQGRKLWPNIFGSDDQEGYRKERVPKNELNTFAKLLSDLKISSEETKTYRDTIKKHGISDMYKIAKALHSTKSQHEQDSFINPYLKHLEDTYDYLNLRQGNEVMLGDSLVKPFSLSQQQ